MYSASSLIPISGFTELLSYSFKSSNFTRWCMKILSTYTPSSAEDIPYDGLLPVHAGEYGGVAYGAKGNGWGYRTGSSEEEFVDG